MDFVYGRDNLNDYYEAFGLRPCDDETMQLREVLWFLEDKKIHKDCAKVLDWLSEFSINLVYQLETKEIAWDFSGVTEVSEQRIARLLSDSFSDEALKYPIKSDDLMFYKENEELISELLDLIKQELDEIWWKIHYSLEDQYSNMMVELEEGGALFTVDGKFAKYID